jgi:ABC-type sugar transport system substrate-binding protein
MAKWQNGKMAKWQNGKMAKWQNGKMAKWQNGKMALTIFQDAKGQATGAVKVTKALLDKQKVQVYNWTPYKTITPENHSQFAAQ